MEFEFLQRARGRHVKRRWSWQRFWLAFSCGGLLLIGTLAMVKVIRSGMAAKIAEPEAPLETFSPPVVDQTRPDVLRERPSDRSVPDAVNQFLQAERSLNVERLEKLSERGVRFEEVDYSPRCLPQWDFRKESREVIWFYHYQACKLAPNQPVTVFGAVDGLGYPIFQHPPLNEDPLALLDSQYAALKWVALEKPSLALVVGSNGPWPRSGAIIDVFLVNTTSSPQFWRFRDGAFEESPPSSAQLIEFRDHTGDGYRDLCAFRLEGDESQIGVIHPFLPAIGSFALEPTKLPAGPLSALHQSFNRIHDGAQMDYPFVLGAPATERVFDQEEPEEESVPSDES